MLESTSRLAWSSTIWQGMGSGLNAFKHLIIRKSNGKSEIVKDFDWTADANSVKIKSRGK